MTVEIRRAAPDEAPVVRSLLHQAYAANAAAGFNFTAATVGRPEVEETFGFHGPRLLAFAEERVRAMGKDRACLNTPVNHPWLPDFYRRCGYVAVRVVHYPGKTYDSVEFEKPLGPRPSEPPSV